MSADRLREFLDNAAAGPWRPEDDLDGDGLRRRRDTIWLTNDEGDSLQVDEDDAALLINTAALSAPPLIDPRTRLDPITLLRDLTSPEWHDCKCDVHEAARYYLAVLDRRPEARA